MEKEPTKPINPNLQEVDWSALPAPEDDGGAAHLNGMAVPSLPLTDTSGEFVDISALQGKTIIFSYPMTGRPDVALPDNWDMIPGARGCTPQACAFRDTYSELRAAGITSVYGLSTQDTDYQREAAGRLHLPFPLLSDSDLKLTQALKLPTMEVQSMTLLKRLTLVVSDGVIEKTFYPVFPPDQSADMVMNWLNGSIETGV